MLDNEENAVESESLPNYTATSRYRNLIDSEVVGEPSRGEWSTDRSLCERTYAERVDWRKEEELDPRDEGIERVEEEEERIEKIGRILV